MTTTKALVDLDPHFVSGGGCINTATGETTPRRQGVGIQLECPCGCDSPLYVPFANPLDGGEREDAHGKGWQRTGETFETLTLTPSILRVGGCAWHGFLTNGQLVSV